LLERHLPGALATVQLDDRFNFLLAARFLTNRLISLGTHSIKLRLPQGSSAPDAKGKVDVSSLGDWFLAQAQDIARRFDERNGTSAYQRQIDELPELLGKALD
jgi:hypothetical protein